MQGVVNVLDIIQNVALGHEQVLPAIVVEVLQANTPARAACSKRAQTGFEASSGKETRAVVVIKTVNRPRKHGHKDVRLAVVVVVMEDRTQTGKRLAIHGKRSAGFEGALRERTVAVIAEEELLHAIVGYEDVGEAVVVIVGEGHA